MYAEESAEEEGKRRREGGRGADAGDAREVEQSGPKEAFVEESHEEEEQRMRQAFSRLVWPIGSKKKRF